MKKILQYQSLETIFKIEYKAGKTALDRSYNLIIYSKGKEIVNLPIIDNLAGDTIKGKFTAIERIINPNYELKEFLIVPEIEKEISDINAELSKKYWEYKEKLKEKTIQNMRKGIYYFN